MLNFREEKTQDEIQDNNDFYDNLLDNTQAGQGITLINNGNNQIVKFGFEVMAIKEENGDINDYLICLGELKIKLTKEDIIKIGFSV